MSTSTERPFLHVGQLFGRLSEIFPEENLSLWSQEARIWHLVLRKESEFFHWFIYNTENKNLIATSCKGPNIGQTCHLARLRWARWGFRTLHCGTLFILPERDEIGSPALFHEMVQSLSNSSGAVFDPNRGYSYRVDQISEEAIRFYKEIK